MSSLQASLPQLTQGLKNVTDFEGYAALALGLISGVEPEVKFGHSPDMGAVLSDVWERALAQPLYVYPVDAGELMEIVSTDIGDDQDIKIIRLDPDGVEIIQTITLNGTVAVPIPNLGRAVNRAFNDDATDFAGTVSIQGDGSTSVEIFAQMMPDDQQTSQAVYMVPKDKLMVMNNISTAINKTGGPTVSSTFALNIAKPGKVFRTQIRYGLQREGTSNISSDLIVPVVAPPLSKVKVTALPSSGPLDVSAEFSMWLVDVAQVPAATLAAITANS